MVTKDDASLTLGFSQRFANVYEKTQTALVYGAAVLLPVKLAFALVPLLALNLLFLIYHATLFFERRHGAFRSDTAKYSGPAPTPLFGGDLRSGMIPLAIFIGITAMSAFFGIEPTRSLTNLLSFTFYCTTIPAVCAVAQRTGIAPLLTVLTVSQGAAGLNAILNGAFPETVPRLLLGKVTESGQIALTLVLAAGLALSGVRSTGDSLEKLHAVRRSAAIGSLLFLTSAGLTFHAAFIPDSAPAGPALMLLMFALIAAGIRTAWTMRQFRSAALEIAVAIPLIAATLLANLKRGPLAGVFIGGSLLLLLHGRRLLVPLAGAVVLLVAVVTPVRERIEQSSEHFFISGGRSVIWEIGSELAARYPLGIGYDNSKVLRKFSSEIPHELRHFHNNLLNIVVEAGWIGLMLYLWWIATLLRIGFRGVVPAVDASAHSEQSRACASEQQGCRVGILMNSIAAAFLSWQVAGLVEYNFGDSEVTLLAFFIAGLLLSGNELKSSAKVGSRNLPQTLLQRLRRFKQSRAPA